MRKALILAASISLLGNPRAPAGGGMNDPILRMKLGQALAGQKKYAEALDDYLWCFDHGTNDPSFVGVRGSFLLSDIAALSANYPPAKTALEERRDKAEAAARAGSAPIPVVFDAMELNRALNQRDRNLTLFDALAPGDPARKACVRLLFDELLKARRYKEITAALDPLADFAEQVAGYDRLEGVYRTPGVNGRHVEEVQRRYVILHGAGLLEAVAGVNDHDMARKLEAKILAFDRSPDTRERLAAAAARAGDTALAAEIRTGK